MRKLTASFFISLDGVVEAPQSWHFPYFNDEMGAVVGKGMEEAEAFLMGRVGYQQWADYWPQQGPEVPFSEFINGIKKYVVSSTLKEATWANSTLVTGDDIAGQLQKIKDSTSGNISMSGSATTVRWLLASGLLDELQLLIHPIAVGKGQRLFEDTPTYPLELSHQETLETGVIYTVYKPASQ